MATPATHRCWLRGPRRELIVYISVDDPGRAELLARLGKHRMTKSCLYFERLADLDVEVLEALIAGYVAEVKRRYSGAREA